MPGHHCIRHTWIYFSGRMNTNKERGKEVVPSVVHKYGSSVAALYNCPASPISFLESRLY